MMFCVVLRRVSRVWIGGFFGGSSFAAHPNTPARANAGASHGRTADRRISKIFITTFSPSRWPPDIGRMPERVLASSHRLHASLIFQAKSPSQQACLASYHLRIGPHDAASP
jgi:hypothetical protein